MTRRILLILTITMTSGLGVGCGGGDDDHRGDSAGTAGAEEELGLIEMALETVPPDVLCVRVTAKGPQREKVVDVPVVPGPAVAHTLSGFPLGKVTFVAEAFAGACASVTAKTASTWVSDPVEASVVEGTKTRVNFNMQRNGRVDLAFDFAEEAACTAAGAACKSGRECCSNSCKQGLCQP